MLEELKMGELKFETVKEFLAEIKKEFGGEKEESVKVAELRKMMKEFVQEFKRAARRSGYEKRSLVEEFKRGMNRAIRMKLMEAKIQPGSIKQWYKRATALNKNWKESKQEEERLRGKKKQMGGAPKQEQRQILPQPLVWQRRQMPSQQVTTGPTLIEGIERTNTVIIREQRQEMGALKRDPYMVADGRRLEY